jgi:hypothetical protein
MAGRPRYGRLGVRSYGRAGVRSYVGEWCPRGR